MHGGDRYAEEILVHKDALRLMEVCISLLLRHRAVCACNSRIIIRVGNTVKIQRGIRDIKCQIVDGIRKVRRPVVSQQLERCLLYTSDAADDR